MGDSERGSAAKERWKILGNALRGRKSDPSSVSVRRFANFNLFSKRQLLCHEIPYDEKHAWLKYSWLHGPCPELRIRHLKESVSASEMIGFNNTGNVCVWPSEEVLAHYLLRHPQQFRGASVCELGGGMTCLAGLALGATVPLANLVLTDGNDRSADNIACVLATNADQLLTSSHSSRCLLWNRSCAYEELHGQFDFLVCADCFFFTEFHVDLVHVVKTLLKPDGKAIFFAPKRSGTLTAFTEVAAATFHIAVSAEHDEAVTQQHSLALQAADSGYSEDLHYPLLVELTLKH